MTPLPLRPFHDENILSQSSRGYEWKVVLDPTRDGEDPGYFYGRLFRMIDIHHSRGERSTWPDGIVFQHVVSGRELSYRNGVLWDLTQGCCLSRKPRIRVRTRKPSMKG